MRRKRGARCWFCGAHLTPNEVTRDHLTPKSAGGRTHEHNLVISCRPCNERKGALSLEAYRSQHNFGALFWGEAREGKK